MLDIGISFWYNILCCETLAQSVEHTPFKRRVEGSNPSCLTTGELPGASTKSLASSLSFYIRLTLLSLTALSYFLSGVSALFFIHLIYNPEWEKTSA